MAKRSVAAADAAGAEIYPVPEPAAFTGAYLVAPDLGRVASELAQAHPIMLAWVNLNTVGCLWHWVPLKVKQRYMPLAQAVRLLVVKDTPINAWAELHGGELPDVIVCVEAGSVAGLHRLGVEALLYRNLRKLDADLRPVEPDFVGWVDEVKQYGPWERQARLVVEAAGAWVQQGTLGGSEGRPA